MFIDVDDLKDLDDLFEIVGKDTATVVALSSAQLLYRPWCVGELVTAWNEDVPIVRVTLPDFIPPPSEPSRESKQAVPLLNLLTKMNLMQKATILKFWTRVRNIPTWIRTRRGLARNIHLRLFVPH